MVLLGSRFGSPGSHWVCPVSTDSLPLGYSTSSQANLFVPWGAQMCRGRVSSPRAARRFSEGFWSVQNSCKSPYFYLGTFLDLSGYLLGLLHVAAQESIFGWRREARFRLRVLEL